MVQGVTPAHKGLAPSRLIPIFIRKDAHAGHTQEIKLIPFVTSGGTIFIPNVRLN
jgi:hypothetical protein